MNYGSINGISLYRNFWISIIKYIPEAFWCKLYLNTKFIILLKSQISIDNFRELSSLGKLESLKSLQVDFMQLNVIVITM